MLLASAPRWGTSPSGVIRSMTSGSNAERPCDASLGADPARREMASEAILAEDLRDRVGRDRLVGAPAHPRVGLLAEARALQLLEETTEAAARAAAAPEHLPEQITDAATARCTIHRDRRSALAAAVREHVEHHRCQGDQHPAHVRAVSGSPRLRLGAAARFLCGHSPEKIVEKPHGSPPCRRADAART